LVHVMQTLFLKIGAFYMLLAVAIGAFGAHGLKGKISTEMLAVYQTGVFYHAIHGLGLLVIGLLLQSMQDSALLRWSGWALTLGVLLFSGSLYVLSITSIRWLGAITPLGGLAFLVGWALLLAALFKAHG